LAENGLPGDDAFTAEWMVGHPKIVALAALTGPYSSQKADSHPAQRSN
jgi:hypothetical protein